MTIYFLRAIFCVLISASAGWSTTIHVEATLPVLATIAKEIGGPWVEVGHLAYPNQDPHFVEPRPTLIKRLRRADALIEIGMGLELWAQKAVEGSANPKIQNNMPGRIIASYGVTPLEIPKEISRALGDVHPMGNPHVWLDPLRVIAIAEQISKGFCKILPVKQVEIQMRFEAFATRVLEALIGPKLAHAIGVKKAILLMQRNELNRYLEQQKQLPQLGGWLKQAEPLKGRQLISYHKTWAYLAERFGFSVAMEIEERPGISPTLKHRDVVIQTIQKKQVKAIIIEPFYDQRAAQYISKKTRVPVVVLPIDVGSKGDFDYFHWMDGLLQQLVSAIGKNHG